MMKRPALVILLMCSACGHDAAEVPALTRKLSSTDTSERNQAALTLSRMGEKAEPATRALIGLLKDPNAGVRTSAALALREIGTKESIHALDEYQRTH